MAHETPFFFFMLNGNYCGTEKAQKVLELTRISINPIVYLTGKLDVLAWHRVWFQRMWEHGG